MLLDSIKKGLRSLLTPWTGKKREREGEGDAEEPSPKRPSSTKKVLQFSQPAADQHEAGPSQRVPTPQQEQLQQQPQQPQPPARPSLQEQQQRQRPARPRLGEELVKQAARPVTAYNSPQPPTSLHARPGLPRLQPLHTPGHSSVRAQASPAARAGSAQQPSVQQLSASKQQPLRSVVFGQVSQRRPADAQLCCFSCAGWEEDLVQHAVLTKRWPVRRAHPRTCRRRSAAFRASPSAARRAGRAAHSCQPPPAGRQDASPPAAPAPERLACLQPWESASPRPRGLLSPAWRTPRWVGRGPAASAA